MVSGNSMHISEYLLQHTSMPSDCCFLSILYKFEFYILKFTLNCTYTYIYISVAVVC